VPSAIRQWLGVTAVQRTFFEKSFGTTWLRLSKPLKLRRNGEFIDVDKYVK